MKSAIVPTLLLLIVAVSGAQKQKVAPPNTCAQHVALSADGALLVVAGTPQHSMMAFNTATAIIAWTANIPPGKSPIDVLGFSPTGNRIIIGYWNSSFEPRAAASGQSIPDVNVRATDGVRDMAFSRDGRLFAVLTQAAQIRVYSTSDWKEVGSIENARATNGLALSPDGARVAAGSISEAKIWEVQTGKPIQSIGTKGGNRPSLFMDSYERLAQLWKVVWKVEFSADGRRLATATDGYIQVWDAETGSKVAVVRSGGRPGTLIFSGDGKRIAWATWNGELRIWELDTKRLVKVKIPTLFGEIAMSRDFSRAYVPDWRESVRVIEVPSGKQLSAFRCSTQ
ncbi:MAG: WD40 repeat domain-containing protein [Terriglobia bacterium]